MLASLTMVPMLMRWRRASRASGTRQTPSSSGSDPTVVGIGGKRRTAAANEVETPLPLLVGQVPVRVRAADLAEQVGGHEPAAERDRHQVLHQDVQRPVRRASVPRPGAPATARLGRGSLQQLQAVGRHQRHPRRSTRRMAGATGPLQQARDAFRGADLQDPLDRQEVDPEIEAGGADHRPQATFLGAEFDPVAGGPVE